MTSLTPGWIPRFWTVVMSRWDCSGLSDSRLRWPWQVMLVIDTAVTNVEDLSSLEEYLAGLGKKHRAVGVKLSSFSVGKGALALSGAPHLRPQLSQSSLFICSFSLFPSPQMTRTRRGGWWGGCICYFCAV